MYIKAKIVGHNQPNGKLAVSKPRTAYLLVSDTKFWVSDERVCAKSLSASEEYSFVIADTPEQFEARLRKANLLIE